ncbi:hypothetical protein [Methanothrix harundinacea]|uniref:Uncharacterized protein n=1 Tax=Methanothrix harundinacea (strain 6Ac) TaxID=1110509 RepID=G7WN72_METH6|nr:hypothetical protein [Methanothrix harundinacea]AET63928.1 hypothetical protein Mhar_0548 [Methanothrix harundinacea 6Ac]
MKRELAILLVIGVALVGMAGAANYMYEKANIKGVGYKNVEIIIQTQPGLNGNKLVEKESGSGNVITQRTEIEAERDPFGPWCCNEPCGSEYNSTTPGPCIIEGWNDPCCCVDYINFNKEAEFEYMPVSYQTGTYDQKWIEKLCVQNYYIGAVVVEMYTHAEHLQKNTEVKTRRDCGVWDPEGCGSDGCFGCGNCTGALEANFNSNVIGVAHIGWLSKDVMVNCKGRHYEWGRSVEDLTGVFSIEKFIQLWGNGTCGEVQVDWLPCI